MFDRSRPEAAAEQGVTVEIVLISGRLINGKLIVPLSKTPSEALNGPGGFMEVLPFAGERLFVAKGSIQSLRVVTLPPISQMAERVRDLDGFDPHKVLGVKPGAAWDEIRQAFLALSKVYHPDRFETLDLPDEVKSYLAGMARRINAAFEALEDARVPVIRRADRAKPVYESTART